MEIVLRGVQLPGFGAPEAPRSLSADEYEARARALISVAGTDWVVIYGDREHAANLTFLTGFDPRFEEAILVLGPNDGRALVVGNEGLGYTAFSGLPAKVVLCQSLSLMGQPRHEAPRVIDVLREIGIATGARVGIVGWKYLEAEESDAASAPSFVPAFLVRDLHHVVGTEPIDVTTALMHPERGVRTRNSAAQIAAFEWGAVRSSEAVLRIVRGVEPGMTELEAAGLMGYQGEPMSMHPIFASGKDAINGLRSPSPRRIEPGDGAVAAVGYWGGLTCRGGLVTERPDGEFFTRIVCPYYSAIATWYATMRIGVAGGEVHEAVAGVLAGAGFGSLLNPGHLTSYDEWVHSPIRPGSDERVASGMVFQCDVIPSSLSPGWALNCEDTVAIADERLRNELAHQYPDLWHRVEARRAFMEAELGLRLAPELLPLSNMPAYLPPFWGDDALVCVVAG